MNMTNKQCLEWILDLVDQGKDGVMEALRASSSGNQEKTTHELVDIDIRLGQIEILVKQLMSDSES